MATSCHSPDPLASFDANATSPTLPAAWQAWEQAQRQLEITPALAPAYLWQARTAVAAALQVVPERILFTSGGTEADAQGIWIGLAMARGQKGHVVCSAVEHAAVDQSLDRLAAAHGWQVHRVAANRRGVMEVEALLEAASTDTGLLCLTLACNETGVVQPVQEVSRRCADRGIGVHCDAVQALGRLTVDPAALQVQTLALSGHKVGALGGIGALVLPSGAARKLALLPDAGAANVPGACSLAAAMQHLPDAATQRRRAALRDAFESGLQAALPSIEIIGRGAPRLCNTSCVLIPGVAADGLLMALDLQDFSVSTGSACSSGSLEPSPILLGMGLSRTQAKQTLRISMHNEVHRTQVQALTQSLAAAAKKAQAMP